MPHGKTTFFRAKMEPSDPDYDPAANDSTTMAMGAATIGITGWFQCPACGSPRGIHPGIVTTPDGRKYAYGLCPPCHGAMADENHFEVGPPVPVRHPGTGETIMVPRPLTEPAPAKGRIGRLIDEALDRFIAAGEPLPEGAER